MKPLIVKKISIFLFLIACFFAAGTAKAAHIVGGEMFYKTIGPGASGTMRYSITLRLFRDAGAATQLQTSSLSVRININDAANTFVRVTPVDPVLPFNFITLTTPPPCIQNPPTVSYQLGIYTGIVDLPINAEGYTLSYGQCCRIGSISNAQGGTGYTYSTNIPGDNALGGLTNNSPVVNIKDTSLICAGKNFELDFGAVDDDADSLTYEFCPAYNWTAGNQNPPFASLSYTFPYTAAQPAGPAVTIDLQTGLISGVINVAGNYVIAVCIREFRNGNEISFHRKDFIIKASDCVSSTAVLPGSIQACDTYTVNFLNLAPSPINQTFFWDFGVPGVTSDTAIIENPSFTYPDTGVYVVKFYVNRGGTCEDSATSTVYVYPGLFPGFINSNPVCVNTPVQFNDTSLSRFGNVVKWEWNMGESGSPGNFPTIKNPVMRYQTAGTKDVMLKIETSLGCTTQVSKQIVVTGFPVIVPAFKDSLICNKDTIQLSAIVSAGTVSWSPNYNIINANGETPLVYPKVTTDYYITASQDGCVSRDTVRVRLLPDVQMQVSNDTALCPGATAVLSVTGNAKTYQWAPANRIEGRTDTSHITIKPVANTSYTVTGAYNNCTSTRSVFVRILPLPQVYAGPDTLICLGGSFQNPIIANGDMFWWNYTGGIDNPGSINPRFTPTRTYRYILSTRNLNGCTRVASDTVFVQVYRAFSASAGDDKVIVAGQSIQLDGSGGGSTFLWTPATGLNNTTALTPLASPVQTQTYLLRASDADGCYATDSVTVTVFKTQPDIFVPDAFTPNGDGLNDILYPTPVGIVKLNYFNVYNRWGKLVFSSVSARNGWDGNIGAVRQEPDTFVWVAKGVDYKGATVLRKGTVLLLR
jgi:gliding motility-associated-like protein